VFIYADITLTSQWIYSNPITEWNKVKVIWMKQDKAVRQCLVYKKTPMSRQYDTYDNNDNSKAQNQD